MCRRFALFDGAQHVADSLGYPIASGATFPPGRYNISPGGPIVAIAATDGEPEVTTLQWSFKPRWAPEDAPRTHVARAESLASSRFWKGAFARHRCLVPVNGWFEWQHEGDLKRPFYFREASSRLLLLAGVFTKQADGEMGCAIVTQPAQGVAKRVHSRMPVVVAAGADAWLDTEVKDRDTLKQHLRPISPSQLVVYAVSMAVNDAAADGQNLLTLFEDISE
ncbi:SOS response-associated peptidase [Vreelandella neptunia]|uniref:SOS response-associated peptidase n=1 Tax=Vreelandella neptunia TaxID=115551 RepID=UPI000C116AC3